MRIKIVSIFILTLFIVLITFSKFAFGPPIIEGEEPECTSDVDCGTCGSGDCAGYYECVAGICTSTCNTDGNTCCSGYLTGTCSGGSCSSLSCQVGSCGVSCCSDADCPPDGWVCSGGSGEYRDYYCSSDYTCKYTVTATCTDQCTAGTKTCFGDSIYTCGDYDADCCTEWGFTYDCNANDGQYCNSENPNILEYRNYYCSGGSCSYSASSIEDCSLKSSTDTDGGDKPFEKGTVTDYITCGGPQPGAYCTYNTYTDSCSGDILTEYYPNGSTYGVKRYSCTSCPSASECTIYYCDDGRCTSKPKECGTPCSGGICDGTGSCYTALGSQTNCPYLDCEVESVPSGYIRTWVNQDCGRTGLYIRGPQSICHPSQCLTTSYCNTPSATLSVMPPQSLPHTYKAGENVNIQVRVTATPSGFTPLVECKMKKINRLNEEVGGVVFTHWGSGTVTFSYNIKPNCEFCEKYHGATCSNCFGSDQSRGSQTKACWGCSGGDATAQQYCSNGCDPSGNWTIDYCRVATDFAINQGWNLAIDEADKIFCVSTLIVPG